MGTVDSRTVNQLKFIQMRIALVRQGLNAKYLPYFDALCEELKGTWWYPTCGRRSLAEQQALYDKGRTPESIAKKEEIVTKAVPGNSAHNWGCATDWVEWNPDWLSSVIYEKSDWEFYGSVVRKVGLFWGGDFSADIIDRPHNQLRLDIPYRAVGDFYKQHGEQAAEAFLEQHFKGK